MHLSQNNCTNLLHILAAALVFTSSIMLSTATVALSEDNSPKGVFLKYHDVLMKAPNVETVTPFMRKGVIDKINDTPAEMRPMMFELMKTLTPHTVLVLSETIKDNHAVLELSNDPNSKSDNADPNLHIKETAKGTVTMVKEDGRWKIDKESWKTSETITGSPSR